MADDKYSDDEREAVVKQIEDLKNIKLEPIGRSKILRKGSDGLYYCFLGGQTDWYGIPEYVMAQERAAPGSVHLVIARWLISKIELYGGSLKPLFDSRESLSLTKTGDYRLEAKTPENGMLPIKNLSGARFPKIHEFRSPISQFKSLTKEQQRDLLNKAGIK